MIPLIYWLYLWQNKEYRVDRMWAFLSGEKRDGLLTKWFMGEKRRPQFTPKIFLLALISLMLIGFGWFGFVSIYVPELLSAIFTYLLIPLWVALAVGILSIPSKIFALLIKILAELKIHKLKNLKVIGVTGSYGKTSTKEAIAAVLSQKYKVHKTPGGVNTLIGVSWDILRGLRSQHEIYVVEMGAYKVGEIKEIVDLVRPKIGVLTGINEQHLGLFGSLKKTIKAKFELIEGLPENGIAVLNTSDFNVNANRSRVKCRLLEYRSNAPDENRQAAIVLGQDFGLSEEQIQKGLASIAEAPHRMKILTGIKGAKIIDDSYSSNPAGFRYALEKATGLGSEQIVVVTTGVYDLGSAAVDVNLDLNDLISAIAAKAYLVEPQHELYFESAKLVTNTDQIWSEIEPILDDSTVILLEGRHRIINQLLLKLTHET